MLGNTKFNPSLIEDEIYEMMDDYEYGTNLYEEGLVYAITDFLTNHTYGFEWNLGCSEWPDRTGGVCYISWIENSHLHMISFDYKKESDWL